MPSTDEKYIQIPKYTSKTKSLADLNAPIDAIQAQLNAFMQQTQKLKSCLIQWDVVIQDGVEVGDLVYYNKKGYYSKAIAGILDKPGINGQTIQTPSSKVQGIIIKVSPQTALLRSGSYTDTCILKTLTEGTAGVYYLSSTKPGKATLQPGWDAVRQPCISYYGDNKFSFISHYLAHDSHHHISFIVKEWKQVQKQVQSEPNWYTYTVKETDAVYNLLSQHSSAVFINGRLGLYDTDYYIQKNVLYWKTDITPTIGSVVVYTHIPFAYGSPLVRSIQSQTLNILADSGNYKIQCAQLKYEDKQKDPNCAIQKIQKNIAYRVPVISNIKGKDGINVTRDSDGTVNISNEQKQGQILIISEIKLNGTQRVSDNLLTYSVFPASIQSSLTAFSTAIKTYAYSADIQLFITYRSPGYTVNYEFYILDNQGTNLKDTINQKAAAELQLFQGSTTQTSHVLNTARVSLGNFDIPKNATIFVKINCAQPSTALYIYNVGFILSNVTKTGI